MTKTCVVCKKYPISGDNTRSFHKFPLNDNIKKQWMVATGISKVTVNCTVCSDHFTTQSYHPTDGFSTIKRLLRNAIPVVDKNELNTGEIVDKRNLHRVENVIHEDSNNPSENMSSIRLNAVDETENGTTTLDSFDDQSYSNDSSTQSADEKIYVDDMSNKLKKKLSTTNMRALNIKRMFRFRDGVETKYICRDEFVTEEAWDKFLRLMLLNRRRIEGLRQRLCRRKKNTDFSHQFDKSEKEEDLCDPEKFLEVILKE